MTSPRQRLGRPTPPRVNNEAALVGALTAFAKSPSTNTSPDNRAAAKSQNAGRSLGRTPTVTSKPPGSDHIPGGENASRQSPGRPVRRDSGAVSTVKDQQSSPEYQRRVAEERIAADRNIQEKPKVQKKPKPLQLLGKNGNTVRPGHAAPMASIDTAIHADGADDSRTPSTSSLVQMFEKTGTRTASAEQHTAIKSPKPMRKSLVLAQEDSIISSQVKPRQLSTSSDASASDPPPLTARSRATDLSSPNSFSSARDSFSPLQGRRESVASKPAAPPPRRASKVPLPPLETKPDLTKPVEDVAHTAPIPIKSAQPSPYTHQSAAASSASIQASYNALHPRWTPALKNDDSLANAIVASSLASSRAPSPAKFQPESARSSHSHHRHHHVFTRTPSPHKRKPASAGGMKHTLRKETSTSADEDDLDEDPYGKHKKKRHIRKHANKYHEGDRKRWRNAVTERERNRYEGVWAANRGLLLGIISDEPPARKTHGAAKSWMNDTGFDMEGIAEEDDSEPASVDARDKDCVHAYVVRDLWSRSRLPVHVLGEIWDLVDNEHRGVLSKEEFVVGLWLVDQRLKGRKLPVKVSDSVWQSVRFLKGIKIKPARDKMNKVKR